MWRPARAASLLSGQEAHLTPYNKGKAQFEEEFTRAKTLTADNPVQQERLQRLHAAYETFMGFEDKLLALRRKKQQHRTVCTAHRVQSWP